MQAAVIGLGNIGMGYDSNSEDSAIVLTHAKAFHLHPEFELVAGIDPSSEKRDLFEKMYKVKSSPSVEDFIINSSTPEVAAIAVPSDQHKDVFVHVAELGIKNVICEKPMGNSFEDAKKISDVSQQYAVNTLINYIRRFDPGIIHIKDLLENGHLGVIEKIHVWYTGNYWVNASHFIDLIFFLTEEEVSEDVIITSRSLSESPDFFLEFNSGLMAYFNSAKAENYELVEMEIIGQHRRMRFLCGGRDIRIEEAEEDKLFSGYKILKEKESFVKTDFSRIQYHVLDSLCESIENKHTVVSNPITALKTSSVLQNIHDQMQ